VTAPTVPAPAVPASSVLLERAYDLSPRVAVRPEAFGALLYHFGTRRLSFLKDRRLLAAVQALSASACARDACTAAGVDEGELPTYARALGQLAATDMIRERA
jgi:putative mycofactocin binding protein MftB